MKAAWRRYPLEPAGLLDWNLLFLQGMRFLQLKNPWSHLRWKGRYCERDEKNWTPELLKYLNFDPKTAQKFDNGGLFKKLLLPISCSEDLQRWFWWCSSPGVFWIAWEDLCQYYDVIYLSWNPALFRESSCIHRYVHVPRGFIKSRVGGARADSVRMSGLQQLGWEAGTREGCLQPSQQPPVQTGSTVSNRGRCRVGAADQTHHWQG